MAGRNLFAQQTTQPAITQPAGVGRNLFAELGPTQEEIAALAPTQFQQPQQLGTQQQVLGIGPEQEIRDSGVPEVALTLGTAALAEPIAGLAGIAAGVLPGPEGQAARAVEATREALTFQPTTPEGQQRLQQVGEVLAPVGEAFETVESALGDFAFELTGSPTAAAAAAASPTAITELLGLGALRKVTRGTRLIDEAGRPTKALRKALDKEGLVFESLTPEARAAIPEVSTGLGLERTAAKSASESAIVEQIKAGSRDTALAPFKVVNDRLEPDKLAKEAARQGFENADIQVIKTANDTTQRKMRQMLTMARRIQKNPRLALDFRPSDVVGESITSRLKFVRDSADEARKQLNNIAETQLRGLDVPTEPIINAFEQAMEGLDITLETGPRGLPKPNFKGSIISKDRASQRAITDLIDLLGEGGRPDALRFHKLKRQLDNLIDFRKKSVEGLSKEGRDVLISMRRSLNDELRAISPEYADVNDTLSLALDTINNYQDVSGSKIDIFGRGSNKAIGTDVRGLLSNRRSRVQLENSLDDVDNAAKQLGGVFDEDVKDLTLFANMLDNRFETVARTSLKGEVEAAVRKAGRPGGLREAAREATVGAAARGAEKLRGVSDFNAFEAMLNLLNE